MSVSAIKVMDIKRAIVIASSIFGAIALLIALTSCANLPARSYSLQYTDEKGRSIGGSVTLGDK